VSNRKLLLADDSVTIQKVINLTFADEGIEVMTVGDGDTAMERFQEFHPDIVLADVNMPGLNGYRICENLRQREESAMIPVILLVGSFESFDENEARRVGANDWLTKPFQSIRQLVTKVTDLLNQPVATNGESQTEAAPSAKAPVERTSYETQPLVMPSEPNPDGADIDALYRQSMTETVPLPASYMSEHTFGDAGMDDDMIETSYVGSGESQSTEFDTQLSVEPASHESNQRPGEFDFSSLSEPRTAVEDHREVTEFDLPLATETPRFADTMPGVAQETVEMNFSEPLAETNVIDFRPSDTDLQPVPFEQTYADTPEVENDHGNGFSFEASSEPEPQIVAESINATGTPQHSFDDTEPLEIPPDSSRPSQDGLEEEIIALSGSGVPLQQTQQQQQLHSQDDISPEFVDAVARKVIEKISENVIRQLAWQVVPQIAESVLREKAIERSDQ